MSVEVIKPVAEAAEIAPPPSLTGVLKVQERIGSILTRKAEPASAITASIGEVGRQRFSPDFTSIRSVDRLKKRGSGRSRRCHSCSKRHSSYNPCEENRISKSQLSKSPIFFTSKPAYGRRSTF